VTAFLIFAVNAGATTLDGDCSIRFFGQSTLHDFEGQVACQPFSVQTEENQVGHKVVQSPVVTVHVSEMNTDNASRDKKMWAMFDQEHFPVIKGQFVELDPELALEQLAASDNSEASLALDLQIRGVSQRIVAKAREVKISPEQIGMIIEFPLSLASFDLEPPSVMGIIRVADEVKVEVQTTLHRRITPAVSASVKEK
jgi:polyisoprenoid-binding protein YceI